MPEKYDPLKSAELTTEQNYNMIDGILNNGPAPVLPPEEKPLDKVREIPPKRRSREREKKRRRCVHLNVMVTPEEQELIYERMAEAGIQNMGAYMRKMALNGYVLHVDLADVRELVSLQRRCANNLNQVAIHANTYGIYPSEIAALQKDYADLWGPLSVLIKKLSEVVEL